MMSNPDQEPESPSVRSFRNYLQVRIKQSGLTPAEIARRASIAPALLYRFLNDQRDLSLETIDKILPVIDAEIESNLRNVVKYYEQTMAEQQAMFEAIATVKSQEGALESAILGLKEAIQVLAAIRDAMGYDFKETIGYEVDEDPTDEADVNPKDKSES